MSAETAEIFNEELPRLREEFKDAMNSNPNPNNLGVGDIIEVRFDAFISDREPPFMARVTKVVDRFRSVYVGWKKLDGTRYSKVGSSEDGSDQRFCHLVSKAPGKPVYPLANPHFGKVSGKRNRFSKASSGVWAGDLTGLVLYCLSASPYHDLPYSFSPERVKTLWKKDGMPGLKTMDRWGINDIRIKTFRKWLRANISRIKRTKREYVREQIEHEEWERRSYEDDMDANFSHHEGFRWTPKPHYYASRDGSVVSPKRSGDYVFVEAPMNGNFKVGDLKPDEWEVVYLRNYKKYEEQEA